MQDTTSRRGAHNKLRHDLLNPVNVLTGAAGALAGSTLDETQRTWVRMIQNAARELQDIAARLDDYDEPPEIDGQERLADLCSIAVARVGKPVERRALIEVLSRVGGAGPLRILLVDDSPEFAQLVRAYLRGMPWELDVVDTGERAVAQASTERYDIVLMDIDLPGVDGATAAHAIRAADLARGASPTPIVAITAFDQGVQVLAHDDDAPATMDPEIAPLVPEFLANRRAEVETLSRALAAGEFARIQSSGHRMKGTGKGYGFGEISRLGAELERAAHQQDAAAVTRLLRSLDEYLRRIGAGT